jgi:hypothetical protein
LIDERPHSKAPWLVNADCQDSFKRQHIAYHFALVLHLGEMATADAVAVSVSAGGCVNRHQICDLKTLAPTVQILSARHRLGPNILASPESPNIGFPALSGSSVRAE